MPRALVLVLLAGCPTTSHDGEMCEADSQCGDDICARDGECAPASEVRQVKITWTINGVQVPGPEAGEDPNAVYALRRSAINTTTPPISASAPRIGGIGTVWCSSFVAWMGPISKTFF